jgi:pimeloyl-ACP methyl ester carboxylesterase
MLRSKTQPVSASTVLASPASQQHAIPMIDRRKYGTLEGYAEDVLEIFRELHLRKAVFVGHSVSAMIGILAAI